MCERVHRQEPSFFGYVCGNDVEVSADRSKSRYDMKLGSQGNERTVNGQETSAPSIDFTSVQFSSNVLLCLGDIFDAAECSNTGGSDEAEIADFETHCDNPKMWSKKRILRFQ
jgi:hypothetical protein